MEGPGSHFCGRQGSDIYFFYGLLLQFPGDKPGGVEEPGSQRVNIGEANRETDYMSANQANNNQQNHRVSPNQNLGNNADYDGEMENNLIDLNTRPQRMHGQAPNNRVFP